MTLFKLSHNTNQQSESESNISIQSLLQEFIMEITKELSYFYSYLPVESIPKEVPSSINVSSSSVFFPFLK